ncbi:hypothetical protein Hanom_Chr15g01348741 [Helianthus anomalus]
MQATMNLNGRQLPPSSPLKRKERNEMFDLRKQSKIIRPAPPKPAKPMPKPVPLRAMAPTKPSKAEAHPSAQADMLLAGYMAHEFLTKGTLLGQLYDPTKADVPPAAIRTMRKLNNGSVNWGNRKAVELEPKPSENKIRREPELTKNQRYVEVSKLLTNGAHIAGVVNPSQLARILHR